MPGTAVPTHETLQVGAPERSDGRPDLLAFRRLDGYLAAGVEAARVRFGPDAAADSFRGLYVSAEQAERRLARPVGEPFLSRHGPVVPGWDEITAAEPGWRWLRREHGLSPTELDVVLLALGPEVDLRYERLYGYLQDDVGRRRPTVDLALDLLTRTPAGRLAGRRLFAAGAPLMRHRLLRLVGDPRAVCPPLLARQLVVDEQLVGILLDEDDAEPSLPGCARMVEPPGAGGEPLDPSLLDLVATARRWPPLRLYFQGPVGSGRQRAARDLAARLGAPLVVVDVSLLPVEDDALADTLEALARSASRRGGVLYLDGVDSLRRDDRALVRRRLGDRLGDHRGVVVLAGTGDWVPWGEPSLGVLSVPFGRPAPAARRRLWAAALAARGTEVDAADVDAVGGLFGIGPGQIEDAVATALSAARRRTASTVAGNDAGPARPSRAELFAAARAQSGHELAALARKIEPAYRWGDIVLPDEVRAQLEELCERVAQRGRVMDDWGFARTLSQGTGVSALFAGPPGTGKTMAAEVVAAELGLDLYKIDLAAVVSKYIGETEKNLERVFSAAADANAILFFDEADALFGKRSDVHEARDRYANMEVAYLLQRMEQYDGLAVLATNQRRNLDDAFTRRLQFIVEFPLPDVVERRRIWQVCFPASAPRNPDVDVDLLAREFRLSGGSIRNIVLAAAFRAATDAAPIGMAHLCAATGRELQKMGRVMVPAVVGATSREG